MGLGSVAGLHDFYQQRVVSYHKQMVEQCRTLMQEYTTLSKQQQLAAGAASSSDTGGSDTLHVIRFVIFLLSMWSSTPTFVYNLNDSKETSKGIDVFITNNKIWIFGNNPFSQGIFVF